VKGAPLEVVADGAVRGLDRPNGAHTELRHHGVLRSRSLGRS
jgi:hypothetical protein